MKKTAFTVIVFAVAVALALVFLLPGTKSGVTAGDIAPAETLVFFHLPNFQRSALRWPQTALAKIGGEQEVQAFLEKPRSKAPEMKEADDALARLGRAKVGEVFLALTGVDESNAKFVGGVSFGGAPADVEALLTGPRAEMHKAQVDGKSGHVTYEKAEIETFTNKDAVVAETMHGGWWLVSNDLDTLKAAIDRVDGKAGMAAKSLAHNAQFTGALAAVPKEGDFELFADVDAIAHRVVPLIAASGTPVPAEAQEMIKQAKALAYSIKMDGTQFREAAFIANPGGTAQAQLPLHALALSTAATAVVLSEALPPVSTPTASMQSMFEMLPGFADFENALKGAGMKPEEFGAVFGPEFGAVLDWPAGDSTPSFALTLDLRDAAKAKAAANAMTAGNDAWAKSDHAGALVLSQKAGGPLGLLQPTIAFGDKFAVLGFSADGVNAVLDRTAASQPRLDTAPAYQAATKLVAAPTSSFAYIDLKSLFERTYGSLRPLAILALAFQPEVGQYIDAGKLPNTATIAQHLSPIVFSNSTSDRGTLIESSGPITFSQLSLIFGGAAVGVVSSGQAKPGGALDLGALGLPMPNLTLPGITPSKPAAPTLPTLPDPPATNPKPEVNPADKPQ